MQWHDAFVAIPEGRFRMGSDDGADDERPVHDVWIGAFEFAVHPVTCGEYARFLRATGHESPRDWPIFSTDPDRPVVGVSWFDCQAYCRWRGSEGSPVRLPTEAEWERAARGGIEGQRYPWGDEIPAWIPDGGRGPLDGPWPVTLGEPNPYGLFGIAAGREDRNGQRPHYPLLVGQVAHRARATTYPEIAARVDALPPSLQLCAGPVVGETPPVPDR